MTEDPNELKALTLICTLTPSPGESSTDKLAHDLDAELSKYNVKNEFIRVVDYNIKPGVETDMGDGDNWPMIRQKMLDSDIFIIATPTWVGQMSSVALRVIERLDAELSELDEQGRPLTFGIVGAVAIVGNEDGAHKITADVFQGLNDLGFTIPAQAATYWNGEAMQRTDYKDLDSIPEKVAGANAIVARNVAHLARLLKSNEYPAAE
ncbi:MAG: flavodoxin-like protein [Candidatus Saccharibacteria bacterium]|nr:flavodoxin-like protein [Candidatus Saccharibacteria bacterium]MDB5181038.1 flavodoxin-like protein [Candidatus Saccharibacteria bacterium]